MLRNVLHYTAPQSAGLLNTPSYRKTCADTKSKQLVLHRTCTFGVPLYNDSGIFDCITVLCRLNCDEVELLADLLLRPRSLLLRLPSFRSGTMPYDFIDFLPPAQTNLVQHSNVLISII